jgi:hypothetical protein
VARKRRAKAKAGSEDFRGTPSALLWAVVAVFLVLSLLFNFRTPVGRNGYFHTPDEGAHIAYVRYVAEQGRLPRFEGYAGWAMRRTSHRCITHSRRRSGE